MRTYKIRQGGNGTQATTYSLTVPPSIAVEVGDLLFTVERTAEGILFRPHIPQEPQIPEWLRR